MKSAVVSAATISTQNMTGFAIMWRGCSFLNAPAIAGTRMLGSVIVETGIRLRMRSTPRGEFASIVLTSIKRARKHRKVLHDRPERERWKICQTADDQNHADNQPDKEGAIGGKGTR